MMEKLDLDNYKETNNSVLKHTGIVSKISKDSITVSLLDNLHCEACHAKGACGVSDSETKEIEVVKTGENFAVNETVQILLKKELGLKAVFWAYVFPFFLLIFTLLISSIFLKEWMAGLVSLLVLIPYYVMLHVLNDVFKKAFRISILKNS